MDNEVIVYINENYYHLLIVKIPRDGNSLFVAISSLVGSSDDHITMRKKIVDYIIAHWGRFKHLVGSRIGSHRIRTEGQYYNYMSQVGVGGSMAELKAACKLFDIRLIIHLADENRTMKFGRSGPVHRLLYSMDDKTAPHIDLLVHGESENFNTLDFENTFENQEPSDSPTKQPGNTPAEDIVMMDYENMESATSTQQQNDPAEDMVTMEYENVDGATTSMQAENDSPEAEGPTPSKQPRKY